MSPTPYGTRADLASTAEICHARGKPLIIGEAWGAHLPFHDALPAWAMDPAPTSAWSGIHNMGIDGGRGQMVSPGHELLDEGFRRHRQPPHLPRHRHPDRH